MNPINGFIIISLLIVIFYGIGLLHYLNDFEQDRCEMTYMFEYPQFVKISSKADELFPKYGLYAYSEGKFTSKARSKIFDGIPVLFIPGNAGSYKQVRSLSSVALRKAVNSRSSFHFDYFTIDFNDELSGLYGPLLYDQISYANRSLYRIFELYSDRKNKPTSIILIGHSMGGVIARNLLSQMSDPNLISILVALAVPLKRIPIMLDYHMHDFYENTVWKIPDTVNTTIISLSGGYSDILIPTYLTDLQRNNSLSAVITNIPRCWIEANHIQIIWCKQVVLAINRALFDSVDRRTKQISLNSTYRNMVFKHYITEDSGIKIQNSDNYFDIMKIDYRGQWVENLLRQYSIQFLSGLKEPHWYMVRLTSLPAHEMLSVLAINLEVVDWIFACNANFPKGPSRVCTEAIHLTHLSKIWPSTKYKRRYFEINMNELRKNNSELTHVVFRALPTNEPVIFHVDVYNLGERQITVNLPQWWSLKKHIILEKTLPNAVYYELVLPQLQHIIQHYQLFIEPIDCAVGYNHASASLIVPWSNQNHHQFFTNINKSPLKVRLYDAKPLYGTTQPVTVKLTLEPSCTYQISIKSSIVGTFGQITRFYTPLLLSNIAAVVLMCLRIQLRSLKDFRHFSIIFVAIKAAKPFYVVPFAKLLSTVIREAELLNYLPKPDVSYLIEDGIDYFFLPILLYMCSVGIVWIVAVIFTISLITMGATVHKLALKLLARTVSFNIAWSDYLMSALHKVPFIVAGSLIFICFSSCGGLALCLGTIFYFLKLTQMSQDYVEEVVWFIIKKIAKSCKETLNKKKTTVTYKTEKPSTSLKSTKDATETIKTDNVIRNLGEVNDKKIEELVSKADDSFKNQTNINLVSKNVTSQVIASDEICLETESNKDFKRMIIKNEKQGEQDDKEYNEKNLNESLEDKDSNEQEKEKPVKDNIKQKLKENHLSIGYNSIFFHTTLFFIWCIITLINIPAVLTWAHNFRFSKTLSPDDSFISGLALSLCAFPLWQLEFPKLDRKWVGQLEILLIIFAVISVMFTTISVYRLNYLLSLTIVIITLHQLFAPKLDENIEQVYKVDDDTQNKYENVKTKLE